MSKTLRLWSRLASLSPVSCVSQYQPVSSSPYRPATTHPQLPPPHTMMSNSSGRVPTLFVYDAAMFELAYSGQRGTNCCKILLVESEGSTGDERPPHLLYRQPKRVYDAEFASNTIMAGLEMPRDLRRSSLDAQSWLKGDIQAVIFAYGSDAGTNRRRITTGHLGREDGFIFHQLLSLHWAKFVSSGCGWTNGVGLAAFVGKGLICRMSLCAVLSGRSKVWPWGGKCPRVLSELCFSPRAYPPSCYAHCFSHGASPCPL